MVMRLSHMVLCRPELGRQVEKNSEDDCKGVLLTISTGNEAAVAKPSRREGTTQD